MKNTITALALAAACCGAAKGRAEAFDYSGTASSVYQWSVTSHAPDEDRQDGRAFLWIPEKCERVRGVVVGQQNMLEEPVFECPAFRKELAKADIGIVFIAPKQCGVWKFGKRDWLEDILERLAEKSGYGELATCRVGFIGHSAMAMWPYFAASEMCDRAFAGVSLKGAWADMTKDWANDAVGKGLEGIPFLLLDGEYEDAENRGRRTRAFCNKYPGVPFSFCAEDGAGHFDWSDELAHYLGIYFRKALRYSKGDKGTWLPCWKRYGEKSEGWEGYWYFDKQMAKATDYMQERFRQCKKTPLVGYRYKGRALEQHDDHLQIHIPYEGETRFSFTPAFDETVVESTGGRLADWTGLPVGAAVEHPADEKSLYVQKICGPCAKTGEDEYELRFNRGWPMPQPGKSVDICFQAIFPGDGEYQRAVQQASMRVVAPREPTGEKGFYVREGAATVNPATGEIEPLPLPPRAKRPHRVTVIEWEWGGEEKERTHVL